MTGALLETTVKQALDRRKNPHLAPLADTLSELRRFAEAHPSAEIDIAPETRQ
jgi:hypothetical protein